MNMMAHLPVKLLKYGCFALGSVNESALSAGRLPKFPGNKPHQIQLDSHKKY